ncbi:MAG: flavin reductase family protein [Pseudomonadota bacterium]
MIVNVSRNKASRLINHGPVVLVTCGGAKEPNIITIAWAMPVSKDPPYVAISVGANRYSHRLITKKEEFVICVPPLKLMNKVWTCGTISGASADKFREAGLTPRKLEELATPGIEECIAHLECRVVNAIKAGDHTVFIGEIVHAEAVKEYFNADGTAKPAKALTFHHLGSNRFAITGRQAIPSASRK